MWVCLASLYCTAVCTTFPPHGTGTHMFLMYHVNVGHVYYTYMKHEGSHYYYYVREYVYVHVCMCTCIYVCIHTHSYVCMYDVYVVQNVSNLSKPGKRKINKFLLFSAKKNTCKLCTGVSGTVTRVHYRYCIYIHTYRVAHHNHSIHNTQHFFTTGVQVKYSCLHVVHKGVPD